MAFIHKETFNMYNNSNIGGYNIGDIDSFFEVDDFMAPIISKLNKKGYATLNCCQGHPYNTLLDGVFKLNNGERIHDKVNGKINNVISISNGVKYVFYEQQMIPNAYIMFDEHVRLPSIPKGWTIDEDYPDNLVIRKIYHNHTQCMDFFDELLKDTKYLYEFVLELPPCTTSPDNDWNECVNELLIKLQSISDIESDIIRTCYAQGKEADEIFHIIVNDK